MAIFKTNFWDLLGEKEQRENKRYNNVSSMSEAMGISRATFYKYANDELPSVDAGTVESFLRFLDLNIEDLHRFLYIVGDEKQPNARRPNAAVNIVGEYA